MPPEPAHKDACLRYPGAHASSVRVRGASSSAEGNPPRFFKQAPKVRTVMLHGQGTVTKR